MKKALLWIIGIVVGVPVAIVLFAAFLLFVFFPAQHTWNVYRMDAKNDRVWEEAIARVATVEAKLGSEGRVDTIKADVICYKGYWARPLTLKGGAPKTGFSPTSIGYEALEADLPTGAIMAIDFDYLCGQVLRHEANDLPFSFRYAARSNIVARDLSLYCPLPRFRGPPDEYSVQTDAVRVSHLRIVEIEEKPLQTLATRSEMGTSETPSIPSGFTRRWSEVTLSRRRGRGSWSAEKGCWTDTVGRCNEALTRYCGKNPR